MIMRGFRFESPTYAISINNSTGETLTEASITSSDSLEQPKPNKHQAALDAEGRIAPYVDFGDFYQAVHKAKDEGSIPLDSVY